MNFWYINSIASQEVHLTNTGRTIVNQKFLPGLELKTRKLEDLSNSPTRLATKRSKDTKKNISASPFLPPTDSSNTIKMLNESLMSEKKVKGIFAKIKYC